MVVKCKIFYGTPQTVERRVNDWIKNVNPSPLKTEAKESGIQLLHTHVLAFPSGRENVKDKVCVVFFYKELGKSFK